MTSQIPDQMPQPGPPGQATPAADGARRCKQPGCGAELPAATGRGAPRLFCGPACSRQWHNDNRQSASPPSAGQPATTPSGPLAGLHQLLAQAETAVALARAAGARQSEQAATAAMHAARTDAQAAMEAADTARADADAADARALAAGERADARIAGIRSEADAAVAAASAAVSTAHAGRDTALDAAGLARHRADTEISGARQAEADARAENDRVRADAARERDAQAAACAAQLHAIQALADTWRARAEHAEQQLALERDHQRRLTARPFTATDGSTSLSGSDGAPAARTARRPAAARTGRAAAGSQP